MKKLFTVCICLCLSLFAAGCSLGTIESRFPQAGDSPAEGTTAGKARVYMDEIAGKLQDFTGSQLTVKAGEDTYTFDVSKATLECEDGMITGDEISVIYEGQLSDTDTSTVKALKVVDEFHKKNHLKDRVAHGQVQSLTPNTITIKSQSGKTATYPITGTEQYYQNGVSAGAWVFLHFKGKFPESNSGNPMVLNASHLKVLSISDIDPLKVPAPTPAPTPAPEVSPASAEKQFRASVSDMNMNILQIVPDGSAAPLNLDISALPSHFKGGAAPGGLVNVTYTGEFKGNTLAGIVISGVTGEDPDTIDERHITSTVTGAVLGSTANTVTIQTGDGAAVTCRTDHAQDSSTGGLEPGSNIRITFHPSASRESNIYTGLKIEDA